MLSLSSPLSKDGPQISLHPVSPPVDRLVAEGALLISHLLLAGPAQQVARDTLCDLGGHFLETDRTLRSYNAVVVLGSTNINFCLNGF